MFASFIQMFAVTISNRVDPSHFDERQTIYLKLAELFSMEEMQVISEIETLLMTAAALSADSPGDMLGPMFHEMELHNEWIGQFFTPQSVCDMMAMLSAGDGDVAAEKGYVTVCEPACGSGAMILGFAKVMKQRGFCPVQSVVVEATDIDLRCVCMAYIQFSLFGIPAIVIHGNSLTMEQWSTWCTPAYVTGNWEQRLSNEK